MLDLNMDPYILLGIINMDLRDYYDSLEELEEGLNIDLNVLKEKMKNIGYAYNEKTNQFKAIQ
ncbi:MAG: DUF4250 domain-containing protein [Candidatus Izemoplasmataceae bacterium]